MNSKNHTEEEMRLIRIGWCACFNAWWKNKDEMIDFREMEQRLHDEALKEIERDNLH